ncbi:MAG: ABC transporter substrate-binding protein [Sphaerochaeta sp.]|jgi:simple sugar transport system substrate-binding protein|nr:ABC transporter substrate-binding protein [Sphaerochaeta sp.]PKL28362.1 MAG: LacI family transcriptional regulator [Spirochaetae bacterium HGW-Spirochaetae-2]
MKRNIMVLVMVALLVLSAGSIFGAGKTEAAADGPKVIGFSQCDSQQAWRWAETESVKEEAANRGYVLQYNDAQSSQANQIAAVRSFIAQGVDGILLAPQVTTGFGPVLREAKEAGIPVVLLDRKVDESEDLFVTFIGSDFVWEGEQVGKLVLEDTKGKANIVELQGTPGADPAIERKAGFEKVVKANPGMKIILSQTGDFNRTKGKEVMEAFLKAEGKNIDVVYAHNDDMAIGAIQAIKEYGMDPGKDILVYSIDGVRDGFQAMVDGDLNALVECTPLLGPQGFDALEAAWRGESVPKWVKSEDGIFRMADAAALIGGRKF